MARRTRRSIQLVRLQPDTTSGIGHRVVARRAERVAARQAPRGQPAAAKHAVAVDRLRRVVRARGQEAARASEIRRNKELVASKQHEADAHARPPVSGPGGGVVRRGCGNRLQGRSGWRRAVRASGRRRRRSPGAILLRRKTSRISRLARFLSTAPPSFLVAAIPSRPIRALVRQDEQRAVPPVDPAPRS